MIRRRPPRARSTGALRLLLAATCAIALVATSCSGDDESAATTTTDPTGVTVDADGDGPPEASSAGSAMDLLREEPEFSSFLSAVEGTDYEELLECAEPEETLTRGWTNVLAPVDDTYAALAADGPAFDPEDGFGDFTDELLSAAGVAEGAEVDFGLDGRVGVMTWVTGPDDGGGSDDGDEPAGPNGTQNVLFAVEDGRAVLPTDAGTPSLPSIATCGAASTLQVLVLGGTVVEPDDPTSDFPDVVPDDA